MKKILRGLIKILATPFALWLLIKDEGFMIKGSMERWVHAKKKRK